MNDDVEYESASEEGVEMKPMEMRTLRAESLSKELLLWRLKS